MENIKITSQVEWNRLPEKFKRPTQLTVCCDLIIAKVPGNSHTELSHNSSAVLRGNSCAVLRDNSCAELGGQFLCPIARRLLCLIAG